MLGGHLAKTVFVICIDFGYRWNLLTRSHFGDLLFLDDIVYFSTYSRHAMVIHLICVLLENEFQRRKFRRTRHE